MKCLEQFLKELDLPVALNNRLDEEREWRHGTLSSDRCSLSRNAGMEKGLACLGRVRPLTGLKCSGESEMYWGQADKSPEY